MLKLNVSDCEIDLLLPYRHQNSEYSRGNNNEMVKMHKNSNVLRAQFMDADCMRQFFDTPSAHHDFYDIFIYTYSVFIHDNFNTRRLFLSLSHRIALPLKFISWYNFLCHFEFVWWYQWLNSMIWTTVSLHKLAKQK